jgi:hypothetical protein
MLAFFHQSDANLLRVLDRKSVYAAKESKPKCIDEEVGRH